jgi:hypothetical protein
MDIGRFTMFMSETCWYSDVFDNTATAILYLGKMTMQSGPNWRNGLKIVTGKYDDSTGFMIGYWILTNAVGSYIVDLR